MKASIRPWALSIIIMTSAVVVPRAWAGGVSDEIPTSDVAGLAPRISGIPKPLPQGPVQSRVPWMKHGSLLATRSDYTDPASPVSLIYIKEGSQDKCPLDGNPQNLACIIRSEFSDGANRAFIQQEIIKLLCVFGSRGQPVDKEIQEDSLELADAAIRSDDVLSKQLLELMETPTATFRGDNYWSVRYLAFDSAGLDICFVEGTLKPFDILQPRRYSIAESPHFFTPQKLERALTARSAALATERKIRDAGKVLPSTTERAKQN